MPARNKTLVQARQHPPYLAGKVRVGLLWQPPVRASFSADEERLQAALLRGSTPDLTWPQKLAQAAAWACCWAFLTAAAAAVIYLIGEL